MKKQFLLLVAALVCLSASAADKTIKLLAPNLTRTAPLMQALADRHSERAFAATPLSLADLSDLLWAANGVNRPDTGRRTAASAMNRQEVDIYVILPEGAYLFDAAKSELTLVTEQDLRPAVAGRQTAVAEAPVALLLVSDNDKFRGPGSDHDIVMRGVDVGIVSANISLFCSAAGLATVPRGSMDLDALRKGLNLTPAQEPMMNHPVGYAPSQAVGKK